MARGSSLALLLTPEELRDLNLEALEGTLGIATSFLAPLYPASVQPDPVVSITRSYAGQSEDRATIEEGELVRITIAYKLRPSGPRRLLPGEQPPTLRPQAHHPPYHWATPDYWDITVRRLPLRHRGPACQLLRVQE